MRTSGFMLGVCLTLGCSSPVAVPDAGLHPAVIAISGVTDIEVPEVAQVGEEIVIRVKTWAGPGVAYRKGETRTAITESSVLIEPWDDFSHTGGTYDTQFNLVHEVRVSFATPGLRSVVVRGRSVPGYERTEKAFSIQVQ